VLCISAVYINLHDGSLITTGMRKCNGCSRTSLFSEIFMVKGAGGVLSRLMCHAGQVSYIKAMAVNERSPGVYDVYRYG
jgi:hypothetical protein